MGRMYTGSRQSTRSRVFYALRLPPTFRSIAGALARSVAHDAGGRAVPEENLHVTLVFVGDVDAQTLPALERTAESVAEARARDATGTSSVPRITLDRLGAFPRARVAWLAPSSPPESLRALVAALERALDTAGIPFDRRPFHPHLTLARSCRSPVPARSVDPIDWQCEAFELLRSPRGVAGGRYETLARWTLDGPSA